MRIGLRGSKHVYLGLHSSEVEAARVYDRALVLLTGSSAATNFPVSNYTKELEAYQKCVNHLHPTTFAILSKCTALKCPVWGGSSFCESEDAAPISCQGNPALTSAHS